jgi:hypothetical protein
MLLFGDDKSYGWRGKKDHEIPIRVFALNSDMLLRGKACRDGETPPGAYNCHDVQGSSFT